MAPRSETSAGGTAPRTLQIGEVADRVGLSLRTVRFYEEAGLITPAGRTDGGFRLYTDEQVERLLLIKQMKPLGFTVEQMGELLRAHDALQRPGADAAARAAAQARLEAFATLADDGCTRLRAQLEQGEAFAARLRAAAAAAPPG